MRSRRKNRRVIVKKREEGREDMERKEEIKEYTEEMERRWKRLNKEEKTEI